MKRRVDMNKKLHEKTKTISSSRQLKLLYINKLMWTRKEI